MKNLLKSGLIFCMLISLISCSSYKPILDQNAKYRESGEEVAEADVKICMKDADDYLAKHKKSRMAKEAGRSGIWGAIFGSIFGLLIGHDIKGAAIGAGIGAGVGATSGAGGVYAEDKISPDKIKQRYVTNCLNRKGYEIIGWE